MSGLYDKEKPINCKQKCIVDLLIIADPQIYILNSYLVTVNEKCIYVNCSQKVLSALNSVLIF